MKYDFLVLPTFFMVYVYISRVVSEETDERFSYPGQFEPPHDKTKKMTVRTAKTQISLGIRPV